MVSLFGSHKSNLIMTCFFLVSISNYKRLPYTIQPPFKYRGSIKKREQWTHEAHILLYDNPACKLLWSFCKLHHCFFDTVWQIFYISRFPVKILVCTNLLAKSFSSICDNVILDLSWAFVIHRYRTSKSLVSPKKKGVAHNLPATFVMAAGSHERSWRTFRNYASRRKLPTHFLQLHAQR